MKDSTSIKYKIEKLHPWTVTVEDDFYASGILDQKSLNSNEDSDGSR